MNAAGTWRLAPADDLTYSVGLGGEHYLDVEGERRRPTRPQVRALGKRHGLDKTAVDQVVEEVASALAAWPDFADDAGVSRASKADIALAHDAVAESFFAVQHVSSHGRTWRGSDLMRTDASNSAL